MVMLFGRKKKEERVSGTDEEAGKPVEFYFDRKDVRVRMKRLRIPADVLVRPNEISDVDEMKIVIGLQGILRYVDRTYEEHGTFNVHKESIASDIKEIERRLSALEKDKPDKVMSANSKYQVYPTIDAIKRYMEQPWKYHK